MACHPGILADPWRHYLPGHHHSEADHLPTVGKAMWSKSPDEFEIPLCATHHRNRGAVYKNPHTIWVVKVPSLREITDQSFGFNPWYAACVLFYAWRQGPPIDLGI